ncbi:MAG: p-aminobenzoyl-glutamate transport protein [Anaerolineae bacterium]|nr:p-aminobenzoyl-glutamate transport protein [Anaerolineae bacterium]
MSAQPAATQSGILGLIEKVGNKVPHPVMMFLYLIIGVIVLSAILNLLGVSVTEEIAVPVPMDSIVNLYEDSAAPGYYNPTQPYDEQFTIQKETISIRSLLSIEGIRFIFTSFVPNFSGFAVIGITFIALMGAGVAEEAGLMNALIRKLVAVAPAGALSFIIIFVGVLSSVASDAGYLILIPLAAAAFLSVGRHPLVGLAAAFAGVASIFTVNLIPTPIDAMLTEITNESIALAGGQPITIAANLFFGIGSSIVLALVAAIVTEKIIAPRLGEYKGPKAHAEGDKEEISPEAEGRGLRAALFGFLAMLVVILILTVPPGAPLRRPDGQIEGNSPLMDSLLFVIMLFFLISGIAFGKAAGTLKGSGDIIKAVTKTFAGLAGLVFMLLMISQFIAFFNYSNLPRVIAVVLAGILEQANVGALPLLLLMILVIVLLDFIMPGSVPKWAIFAPIFVPLFIRLGVAPESVLAAYRIGDAPVNSITPLMVYLPFILTIAQRYQKEAGIGTIISLMIPYVIVILVAWLILFGLWFVLNIPLGPGYLPQLAP